MSRGLYLAAAADHGRRVLLSTLFGGHKGIEENRNEMLFTKDGARSLGAALLINSKIEFLFKQQLKEKNGG